MSLRPILDKIIIKAQDPVEQTASGIFIANAKNDGVIEAEVYAAGPGAYDDKGNFVEPEVEVGSRVLVNAMSGQKFEYKDEEYVTIINDEIIAILS